MSDPLDLVEISEQALAEVAPQDPAASTGLLAAPVTSQLNEAINSRRKASGLASFLDFDSPGPSGFARRPFVFTRVGEREQGIFIYASLNPEEVRFDLKLREVLEKTGGGEVKHSARFNPDRAEKLGRYLDEIPISFTLTTGNCLPLRFDDGSIKIPGGLNTVYALHELLLESDRILPDGRANDLIVVTNSVPYPELVLEGKMDPGGIQFVMVAENPNMIPGITFTMSTHTTVPRLTSYEGLVASWLCYAPRIGQV